MKLLVATPLVLASLLAVACAGPYGSYGSSTYDAAGFSGFSADPYHQNSMDRSLKRSSSTSSLNDYGRNSGLNGKTGANTFGGYEPASTRRTRSFSTNSGTQGSSPRPYSTDSTTGYSGRLNYY
ncbi:hypothetical protein H4R33_004065 [Dimargaris cristalligena]|nr:hypothetical protein H4R33_004065 [Dimargaris cristalligena]